MWIKFDVAYILRDKLKPQLGNLNRAYTFRHYALAMYEIETYQVCIRP